MKSITVAFQKYHGTGNDFILLNAEKYKEVLNTEMIRFLCNRHFGIGADGLILVGTSSQVDFQMTYFNSDGAEGSMCGNGGRVAVAYAQKHGYIHGKKTKFQAIDGLHEAEILSSAYNSAIVSLQMNVPGQITELQENLFFIDTGSPHAVIFVDNVDLVNVCETGRNIRYSPIIPGNGANVNFVHIGKHEIFIRTYERGVEAETLSCGTGTVATAIVYAEKNNILVEKPVIVHTKGGILQVFYKKQAARFEQVTLTGPASYVYEGNILLI